MRLLDLDPKWIYKTKVFAFRCPHCRSAWLTCKRVLMSQHEQHAIIDAAFGPDTWNVAACRAEKVWTFRELYFETMTVSPSLDASPSGHWHGHIEKGMIVGGAQA